MKKQKKEQPDFKDTTPLKKEIFDAFLKKAIESPKIETRKKSKKLVNVI